MSARRSSVAERLEAYKAKMAAQAASLSQAADADEDALAGEESESSSRARAPETETDRARLIAFYTRVAPDHLKNVDSILQKFEGKRDEMWALLAKMYPGAGAERADAAVDVATRTVPGPSSAARPRTGGGLRTAVKAHAWARRARLVRAMRPVERSTNAPEHLNAPLHVTAMARDI